MKLFNALAMLTVASYGYSVSVQASDVIKLDENLLKQQITDDVPEIQKIQSAFYQSAFNDYSAQDKLAAQVYGGYQRITTNERAIISFMPVWSPVSQYEVGVRKNFRHGFQASLSASVDERSAQVSGFSGDTDYRDITTLNYTFNLSMDLWKDLFGKMTKANLESDQIRRKNSELQKQIQTQAFYVALRRVYWSLVANNEKLKVSRGLLKTAEQQASDARNRKANNIADTGEVARYESQVFARKGSILYLEFERESLLKQLRSLLPSLTSKNIELASYDLEASVNEVLACTQLISSNKDTPYEYTVYDEVLSLLKELEQNQQVLDDAYDKIDVKLSATLKQTGVGSEEVSSGAFEGSIGRAQDDISNNDRSGFAAGVSVNIPLGNPQKRTSTALKLYNQKKLQAERKDVDNKLSNTHQQITRSVNILTQVIQTQKANSEKLGIRLKDMQRKYNQARISVNELIQDQDAKMNSDLAIIDTQLAAVNTLLDYLVVFTQTPCQFNRK